MRLHVKPGTHAACYMDIRCIRKAPVVGQVVAARRGEPGERWSTWRIALIKNLGGSDLLYYLSAE